MIQFCAYQNYGPQMYFIWSALFEKLGKSFLDSTFSIISSAAVGAMRWCQELSEMH